jgi:hypothetical protein
MRGENMIIAKDNSKKQDANEDALSVLITALKAAEARLQRAIETAYDVSPALHGKAIVYELKEVQILLKALERRFEKFGQKI